jgi:hypothetical protein
MAKYYAYSDQLDSEALKRDVEIDGCFVVRNVLAPDEVSRLRSIIKARLDRGGERFSLGKTQPNAAVGIPELSFAFAHEKILSVFKSIYGQDRVVFTGHCDVHMNMLSGWHKDSGEAMGGYFRGDYFNARDCQVHKVAIYLQDATPEDGLTVRLGSHHNPDLKAGREAKLETKAGDLVIFDVRLNHVGQLPDPFEKVLKGVNAYLNGRDRTKEDVAAVQAVKNIYWKLVGRRDRLSIFFTYGVPNNFTYDFSYYNIVRQQKQTKVVESDLPHDLVERLKAAQVTPFNFPAYTPG